jgi:hypothetical protein
LPFSLAKKGAAGCRARGRRVEALMTDELQELIDRDDVFDIEDIVDLDFVPASDDDEIDF